MRSFVRKGSHQVMEDKRYAELMNQLAKMYRQSVQESDERARLRRQEVIEEIQQTMLNFGLTVDDLMGDE